MTAAVREQLPLFRNVETGNPAVDCLQSGGVASGSAPYSAAHTSPEHLFDVGTAKSVPRILSARRWMWFGSVLVCLASIALLVIAFRPGLYTGRRVSSILLAFVLT